MAEHHTTESTDASGTTHTTHTVVTEGSSKSGGASWGLLLIVALAAIAGLVIFTQMSGAEVAKDNAITEAAGEVGEAAGQVGDAAQQAGEAVEEAAQN